MCPRCRITPGPVSFKLVEVTGRKTVFENREHDFPNRIIYFKPPVDSDTLKVQISDNAGKRTVDFMFVLIEK